MLHDIGSFVYGGTARLMLDIFSRLPHDVFDVTVSCHANLYLHDIVQAFQRAGVKTAIFPQPAGIRLIHALTRFIRQERFHIVHTHHYYGNLHCRLAAILAGTPIIMTYQHNWPGEEKGRHRLAFWLLNAWTSTNITVSETIRRYDIEQVGISPSKATTVYNGIDTAIFRPASTEHRLKAKQALGLPSNSEIVGMVGRLVDWKRFDLFIQSASVVLDKHRDVHFLIVGDGEMRESLLQLMRNLNLENHVHFLGWRTDMPAIYHAMDIFCLTSDSGGKSLSQAGGEGFGLVSAEAMASGVPVIAVDTEVNREVITSECGLFCQPTPEDLGAKVIQLIDDIELKRKLSQAAQIRAVERFDIERTARQLSDIYRQAIQNCRK